MSVCHYHPDAPVVEDHSAGDIICTGCGLVVGDRVIDVSAEWRTFNAEYIHTAEESRVGGRQNALLSSSFNLSTNIRTSTTRLSTQASSNTYNQKSMTYKPLNCLTSSSPPTSQSHSPSPIKSFIPATSKRSSGTRDRILITAFKEISTMADRMHVSTNIIERAKYLFAEVIQNEQVMGRSIEAKAAACLYLACRQEDAARTLKEICAISNCPKKELGRTFKTILKLINTTVNVISTEDYVVRFCCRLNLPKSIQIVVLTICRKVKQTQITLNRSPISIVATAIYMASQATANKRNLKEISEVCGVAENTIRITYKQIYPHAGKLFPSDFNFITRIQDLPRIFADDTNTVCMPQLTK